MTQDTVARRLSPQLCHRVRSEDTFPVEWRPLDGRDRFAVRATWPTDHPFFTPVRRGGERCHDPLLVVETLRQAAMALLHSVHGLPLTRHILLSEISLTCDPAGLAVAGDEPDIEIRFADIVLRGEQLAEMLVEWTVRRGARVVATGGGHARFAGGAAYRRLRGGHVEAGVVHPGPWTRRAPAPLTGRARREDVLLSPTGREGVWELVVDTGHPTLFPRPNDHIPGMLFLEAARQAVSAAVWPRPCLPAALRIRFDRYAEFDGGPCLLRAEPRSPAGTAGSARAAGTADVPGTFEVTGYQDGARLFTCELRTG
ncbi:ScbA/BarX family gamma-butyrolactone biosynthesis protein [Streptomyces sp. NPDC006553]|uniref:ScbA/BarX family gamma-butyrolactone biosynthesis protein n=1 Tax=unclassified Streptomyces TaxID=2593676 RepID=UPI002252B3A3|nr:ScbA/BarX family gamma-butyrolactone biosynthesis protein [Streptomyces sp. NBC_00233]MCX5228761.1 ScbA/BarX family gamma-butyrolactone biosynthesis protein [Streptomyces sp. NBC_00233]